MAPGPSNLHPRVLQALIAPLTGHKDPYFLALMEETADLLRQVFGTRNRAVAGPARHRRQRHGGRRWSTCSSRATRSSSACAGFFASRMTEITRRLHGVRTVVVEGEWGHPVDTQRLIDAVRDASAAGAGDGARRNVDGRRAAL